MLLRFQAAQVSDAATATSQYWVFAARLSVPKTDSIPQQLPKVGRVPRSQESKTVLDGRPPPAGIVLVSRSSVTPPELVPLTHPSATSISLSIKAVVDMKSKADVSSPGPEVAPPSVQPEQQLYPFPTSKLLKMIPACAGATEKSSMARATGGKAKVQPRTHIYKSTSGESSTEPVNLQRKRVLESVLS